MTAKSASGRPVGEDLIDPRDEEDTEGLDARLAEVSIFRTLSSDHRVERSRRIDFLFRMCPEPLKLLRTNVTDLTKPKKTYQRG